MLLTSPFRRVLTASLIAVACPLPTPALAQTASGAGMTIGRQGGTGDTVVMPGPRLREPVLRINGRTLDGRREWECAAIAGCRVPALLRVDEVTREQERPAVSDQRGKFALVGLVAGAAAGWGIYAYQCTHGSDCYSPVGGILLAAAGGLVGLFVGLLIAPMPSVP